MGQVVPVGPMFTEAIEFLIAILQSLRDRAKSANPTLNAIVKAKSPEDFVRKAAQEAADRAATDKVGAAEAARRDAEE